MSIRKLTDDVLHMQETVYQLFRCGIAGGVAFVADCGLLWVLRDDSVRRADSDKILDANARSEISVCVDGCGKSVMQAAE